MRPPLPETFLNRTDEDDIRDDVGAARGTTPEQRMEILGSLCRMAAEMIGQQPDPRRTLAWQDSLPEDSVRLMERLRKAARRG